MGDIEEMFHQGLIENKDRDAFHFYGQIIIEIEVYRIEDSRIEDFPMNVQFFGKVSSPGIANRTIKKNAADQSGSFDQISIETIESDFYVDHCLYSFHEYFCGSKSIC